MAREGSPSFQYNTVGSVGGVMASIVAFQAVDPGSTPGRRTGIFLLHLMQCNYMGIQSFRVDAFISAKSK